MITYEDIFITMLGATTLFMLRHTHRIVVAARRRDLLTDDIIGCCESLGFVGCSVICSGVKELHHIKELLGQEYDRYEVIVVLDGELYRPQMLAIIEHYRMVSVNCSPSEELPSASIRHLYRSRQRSYRRLILVDRADASPYHDLDAATAVASYDYLLAVDASTHLCPKAIEMAAITLSQQEAARNEVLYSLSTDSYIFWRNAVIERGGFSPYITRQIPSTRCIYSPIALSYHRRRHQSHTLMLALIVGMTLLCALLLGKAATIALLITIVLLASCAKLCAKLIDNENCSIEVLLCCFRQIGYFFRLRNFSI